MAPWDWDEVRRILASRAHEEVPEPARSRAAVSLVFRDAEEGRPPELLFIRRAEHPLDPWSGQMAFPGGRQEPGDTSLQATAIRETSEEVGLDLERDADFLGPLDEVRAMARLRPVNLVIAPFAFRLRGGATASALHEVRSVHWIPLDRLLHPETRSVHDYVAEGVKLQFPCLRLDDIVIWGLTYRMFDTLAQRLADCIAGHVQPAALEGRT
jgi:8-oxo-dGTP pyrophosphatase MutT (NUDIX family)